MGTAKSRAASSKRVDSDIIEMLYGSKIVFR